MLSARAALLALLLSAAAFAQEQPVGFGFSYIAGTDGQPVVTAVAPGGAAQAAGLVAGDSLVAVGGQSVTGTEVDVQGVLVAAREASATALFEVIRAGALLEVSVGTAPYDPAVLTRLALDFFCVAGECFDGQGTWVAPDGERYAGTFVGGRRHGDGRLSLANGDLYVGTFRDGVLDGRGTYVWADGDLYVGEVRDGAPHGDGVRTYAGGSVYTGEFVAGSRHGTGTFRRGDGTVWLGVWVEGDGVGGTDHAADGAPVAEGPFAE